MILWKRYCIPKPHIRKIEVSYKYQIYNLSINSITIKTCYIQPISYIMHNRQCIQPNFLHQIIPLSIFRCYQLPHKMSIVHNRYLKTY